MMDCKKCHEEAKCVCDNCNVYMCHNCHEICAICEKPVCGKCWFSKHKHTASEISVAPTRVTAPYM